VLARTGALRFPVIAVNDCVTKREVDNVHGTGQSAIDGYLRATGMLLAGRVFVVAGFGQVGRGVAMKARGMGAQVIVTEVRPTTALRACMEGFRVTTMDRAAAEGDAFCTATGMRDVIVGRHLDRMKTGAFLANIGHFDSEIRLADLEARAVERRQARPSLEELKLRDGRRLYLLGKGRVVNLAAAEGNPSEVMDVTFAAQVLALVDLASGPRLPNEVVHLSREQDESVARLKIATMGIATDRWSDVQQRYSPGGRVANAATTGPS
jgi:adenosylhomocysteinase